jgi:hypothetical protein
MATTKVSPDADAIVIEVQSSCRRSQVRGLRRVRGNRSPTFAGLLMGRQLDRRRKNHRPLRTASGQ